MLLEDGKKQHYCWIKKFNRLMCRRNKTSNNGTSRISMHMCGRCSNGFTSKAALSNHEKYCSQSGAVIRGLPKPGPGSILAFNNHFKSMRVPFCIYADFESCIKPINTCQPNPDVSYTNKYQQRTPISFCIFVKCFDSDIYPSSMETYTAKSENDDVGKRFVNKLEDIVKEIYKVVKERKSRFKLKENMIYTNEDKMSFASATTCHICKGDLGKDKVEDHCHLTGNYRGAAHNSCNLIYRVPAFIPVFIHNLSGYDCHLFIKKLMTSP